MRQARTGTSEPTTTDDHWAAANVDPNKAIGIAARNVGSGSQTSNAGRGNDSGGVWKLQIALLVEAMAVEQVPGHVDVVGGVLGLGEDDDRGGPDADDERDREDEQRLEEQVAAAHEAAATVTQR